MIGAWAASGALALGAAALAVPAARRPALGDIGADWLCGELDFDRVEADGRTVRTKSGVLFRIAAVRGVCYDAKVLEAQRALLRRRSELLRDLGRLGVELRLFGVKRERALDIGADWPSPALREIGEAERRAFAACRRVDWFLVASARGAAALVAATDKIAAALADHEPRILSLAADGGAACELTGFLNYLICGELRRDLPAMSRSLSGCLPGCDLRMGSDGLIAARTPAARLYRAVAVGSWPMVASGAALGEVLALDGDIEIAQVCRPWDADKALLLHERQVRAQSAALIGNQALAAESAALVEMLASGETTLFETQCHAVVRAGTEAALESLVQSVCAVLGRHRVGYAVETTAAAAVWFARMPGDRRRRLVRPLTLRDENVAALWPLRHAPAGMARGPLGDRPARMFKTPGGGAYAAQFHVHAVKERAPSGNFVVFAPTGGGKSTLVMHLLGGLAKFPGHRSYIFDSKEGARFMVEAMGGIYQGYDDLALNPLDVGPDTPANRRRVVAVLKTMTAGAEKGADDEETFRHAADMAFKLDPPERTLNAIFELAFARRTPLRRAMAAWVTDGGGRRGHRAHVMNAPRDSLGGFLTGSHMVGVNMSEALDDPDLGPPVVAHVAGACLETGAARADGFCLFFDETAKLLKNEGFRAFALESAREVRKLGGIVGFAFQEPSALDVLGPEADGFLDNTPTKIFLPNGEADPAGLERFNLNAEQKRFVLEGPRRDRADVRQALLIKRDAATGLDETVVLDIDLAMLGPALRFYRAGKEANRELERLKQRWGDQWASHL